MKAKDGHAPEGRHTIIPRLITADVAGLVEFLRLVFDAQGDLHPDRPAELKIGDSIVMVADRWGNLWQVATSLKAAVPK